MNIIKMYMNNVIILILAVRICEDSDTRGSDKRGYTVLYIYNIYIYPRFSIEQTWKIEKLRMRTEMEEQFYTTLHYKVM